LYTLTRRIGPNNKIAWAVHLLPKRFLIAIVISAPPVIPAHNGASQISKGDLQGDLVQQIPKSLIL
jgi:hypothetical protein